MNRPDRFQVRLHSLDPFSADGSPPGFQCRLQSYHVDGWQRLLERNRLGHYWRAGHSVVGLVPPSGSAADASCLAIGWGSLNAAAGDCLVLEGPLGDPITPWRCHHRALLIADLSGFAALLACAKALTAQRCQLALVAADGPPLFRPRPSQQLVPGMPPEAIAAVPLLEDWGIASRIAYSDRGEPGCYEGHILDLAQRWLSAQAQQMAGQPPVGIYAFGSGPLLAQTVQLAAGYLTLTPLTSRQPLLAPSR